MAGLLCEFLTMQGFAAVAVTDAKTAAEALRHIRPDAVLVDPFHLGAAQRQFVRALRLAARGRPVPLVVLEAATASTRNCQTVAAAAATVLPQPLDLGRLAATLRALLAVPQHVLEPAAVLRA